MPKKISIVSAVSLLLLVGLIAIMARTRPEPPQIVSPAQVSVFVPEENAIILLSCDEFLTGCVRGLLPHGETPSPDAISAVTAVQRTRILHRIQERGKTASTSPDSMGADFTIGEDFPYVGDDGNTALNEKLRAAAQELSFLTIDGELFDARMCRISTGRTDEAEHSPSVPLMCDIDSENYLSSHAFTYEEVWQIMKARRAPSDCAKWFQNPVYEETGSLRSIEFCGTEISGEELRQRFGLPSRAISVVFAEDQFCFYCKGRGDNQGMSVSAAVFLAQSGYSADEILSLFYPEANLSRLQY